MNFDIMGLFALHRFRVARRCTGGTARRRKKVPRVQTVCRQVTRPQLLAIPMLMLFSVPPPAHPQTPAIVRPLETAEARIVRREADAILKELRGTVKEALQSRARVIRQGLTRAEEDLLEVRNEIAKLSPLEYFLPTGSALSRQLRLEEYRLNHFTEQQMRIGLALRALSLAERLIEAGRFEESVPVLKQLKQETFGRFPSKDLLKRMAHQSLQDKPTE